MCHRNVHSGIDAGNAAQRGFTLVSAIFLLVVMAALGAFMLTFTSVQHTTSALDIEGSRAYMAAHAGVEWGMYQVLTPPSAPPSGDCTTAALDGLAGTLGGFTVNVSCTRADYSEAGRQISIYRITSTASGGVPGSAYFVERQLQATVSR